MYQKIAKSCKKESDKKSSLNLIIDQKMLKKCKKLFLFELVRPFSSIWKRNQRIWLKILRNIALKLTTGEITKLYAILMKI